MTGAEVNQQLRDKQRRDLAIALETMLKAFHVYRMVTHAFIIGNDRVIDLIEVADARAQTNTLAHIQYR